MKLRKRKEETKEEVDDDDEASGSTSTSSTSSSTPSPNQTPTPINLNSTNSISKRIVLLCDLLGLLVSIYLTYEHMDMSGGDRTKGDGGARACDLSSVLSCTTVLQSQYAYVFRTPVAVMGVVWHLLLLSVPRGSKLSRGLHTSALTGVAYLLWAEYQVRAICMYCTIIHILSLVSAVAAHRAWDSRRHAVWRDDLNRWQARLAAAAVATAALIIAFNVSHYAAQEHIDMECLTEHHVRMYGSSRCPACNYQKSLFAPSSYRSWRRQGLSDFSALPFFVECADSAPACQKARITKLPTWTRNDEEDVFELYRYEGVLSIEELRAFSGCK